MRKRRVTAKFTTVKVSTSFGGASWYYKIHPTHRRDTSSDFISLPVLYSPLRFHHFPSKLQRTFSQSFQTAVIFSRQRAHSLVAHSFLVTPLIFATLCGIVQAFHSIFFSFRESTSQANFLPPCFADSAEQPNDSSKFKPTKESLLGLSVELWNRFATGLLR